MKKQNINLPALCLWLLALGFLLTTSMKCKKENISSKDQLPAITQEGKNTFGFLLNGEVWLPKAPILKNKLDLSYDPGYEGGTLNIIAKRYLSNGDYESFSLGSYNINKVGNYIITTDKVSVNLSGLSGNSCTYLSSDANILESGSLYISKIDLTNKIISGTFNFKLEKVGCPTINATEGRFDMPIE